MQYVYLSVGTVLLLVFVALLVIGSKHADMFEVLDDEKFPLSDIYIVGYMWCKVPIFTLGGKVKENLIRQVKLSYDPKYAEYYATVMWSQLLSFVHLCVMGGFLLAGFMNAGLFLLIGIVCAVVLGSFSMKNLSDELQRRELECKAELPEIVSTLALLTHAGMVLREAWKTIAYSKEGTVYELMRQSCENMENGMSEVEAIHKFGKYSNSFEVQKFTSVFAQSLERGGAELNNFLARQSTEIWELKKQTMLQKGAAAESKLLLPIVLLFVGIIIAVVSGALGMLI